MRATRGLSPEESTWRRSTANDPVLPILAPPVASGRAQTATPGEGYERGSDEYSVPSRLCVKTVEGKLGVHVGLGAKPRVGS